MIRVSKWWNLKYDHRRKFRSQTSDNTDRWKSRGGKSQRREEERRSEKRKSQKKEDAGARKGIKVGIHCVFPMICGSGGGSKSRLAKSTSAEPSGRMRNKCNKKLHAGVARSTFPSQNVQSTPCSDDFWKLRWWKSVRRGGAKHISKSKVLKTDGLGALFEVEMLKSARRCGAKHISKSTCAKHTTLGPLLDVQPRHTTQQRQQPQQQQQLIETREVFLKPGCLHCRLLKPFCAPYIFLVSGLMVVALAGEGRWETLRLPA